MDSTKNIKTDTLVNIPFNECRITHDDKQNINLYHRGQLVLSDYNRVGHYMQTAVLLFKTVKNQRAKWLNLENLCTLRNCIRENANHAIGVDNLIFGEGFNGDDIATVRPLTKARLNLIRQSIKELDPYATV